MISRVTIGKATITGPCDPRTVSNMVFTAIMVLILGVLLAAVCAGVGAAVYAGLAAVLPSAWGPLAVGAGILTGVSMFGRGVYKAVTSPGI